MSTMSVLDYSSPLIMGILNVTPDSFSDGGDFDSVDRAVAHGVDLVSQGADIIDVGGESTRPGARRVSAEEQKRRVIDVIRRLRAEIPNSTAISIDTTLSEVAAAALDAGADIINDVSAGRDDSDMISLAARSTVPIVLMHMQGTPQTMQDSPHYEDVVLEVREFLLERAALARAAGVAATEESGQGDCAGRAGGY